jgi:membrane protease YdiL (CAAX protease family)
MVAYYLSHALFKINLLEENLISHISQLKKNQNVINSYKLAQGFSALGLFVLAPLICAWLFFDKPSEFLQTNRFPGVFSIAALFIVLLASTPAINFLLYVNQQMHLPGWMHPLETWMKHSEDQATIFTDAFLSAVSINGLLLNLIVIALIPAIGEELMFRGIIQQGLQKAIPNKHVAVFIAAAVFSAFHMQFYGFIPRMALGLILGYAFLWSRSLWLSMAGHFFNNAAAVFMAFYARRNGLPFNQDTIGTQKGDVWLIIISLVMTAAGLFYLKKNEIKSSELQDLSA